MISDMKIVVLYVLDTASRVAIENNQDQASVNQFLENDVVALTDDELLENALDWWKKRSAQKGINMPNWCSNKLYMQFSNKESYEAFTVAAEQELENVKHITGGGSFCLMNYFRPYPGSEYEREIMFNLYGTKWFTRIETFQANPLSLEVEVYFDTAWSPPKELYDYMSENRAELEIEELEGYGVERGCDFAWVWSTDEEASLIELAESAEDFDDDYAGGLYEITEGDWSEQQILDFYDLYPEAEHEDYYDYCETMIGSGLAEFFGFHWESGYGG